MSNRSKMEAQGILEEVGYCMDRMRMCKIHAAKVGDPALHKKLDAAIDSGNVVTKHLRDKLGVNG